ncbi:MAG: ECF-type sigma factor [Planctomycetota bacterium]
MATGSSTEDEGRIAENTIDRFVELHYDELRKLASRMLRTESPDHTLQPTALVHEAYMAIAAMHNVQSDEHFFALATRTMRRLLVNHAHKRSAQKRDRKRTRARAGDELPASGLAAIDLIALDEALDTLDKQDRQLATIVELRIFAGLGTSGIAAATGISERSVKRHWMFGRAWLRSKLCH